MNFDPRPGFGEFSQLGDLDVSISSGVKTILISIVGRANYNFFKTEFKGKISQIIEIKFTCLFFTLKVWRFHATFPVGVSSTRNGFVPFSES